MASNRIGRINEEMQKELAALLRQLKDPRVQKTMISITRVDTTSDLRYSKVFVSFLDKDCAREGLQGLKSASGYLRRELGSRLQLRYTPELRIVRRISMPSISGRPRSRMTRSGQWEAIMVLAC